MANNKNGVIILPDEDTIINAGVPDPSKNLSPSKIRMLKRCEAAFYYRYIIGIKMPPTSALTLGSSYDDALTTCYNHKINSKGKDDMKASDVIDAFLTSFNMRSENTEFKDDELPGQIKDIGVKITRKYAETLALKVNPLEVQKKYEIQFPNVDWKFIGISDLIETDGRIHDNKTTKKSPTYKNGKFILDDETKFQMLSYSVAEKMQRGPDAGNTMFVDYAVKTQIPKLIQVEVPIPIESDFKYFKTMTSSAYQRILLLKNGMIKPIPNRSNFLCSRYQCAYWADCEKDFGGTVKP